MSVVYDFSGKVAVITGSSTGIGAATAILFAKSGAQVVVTGRNADNVQSVAKKCADISPIGLTALEVVADLTVEADLKRLVESTINRFGKIDVLVNNAGIHRKASLSEPQYMTKFNEVMQTNLNSVVFLTHKFVEHLERTKGNVINISSISGIQSRSDNSVYCMSKSALDMFTRCMAVELGDKGIRVNGVNPAYIRSTDIFRGISEDVLNALNEKYSRVVPIGRTGELKDVAQSVLFLASDQASFITGTCLLVDGGHIAKSVNFGDILKTTFE